MKYRDYIKSLEKLPHRSENGETLVDTWVNDLEIWSNYACIGYAKIAAANIGLDEETTDKLIKAMYRAFDDISIDEAEKKY